MPDTEATVEQIEALLSDLSTADAAMRDKAEKLVRNLMQLYGAGLTRIMDILSEANITDPIARLAEDKLVGSLLLLHNLHPVSPEMRVRQALHRLERKLDSHHLVLESVSDGTVRVKIESNGYAAAPAWLAERIHQTLADCAPDLGGVEIEGLPSQLVQIAPMAAG